MREVLIYFSSEIPKGCERLQKIKILLLRFIDLFTLRRWENLENVKKEKKFALKFFDLSMKKTLNSFGLVTIF